MGVIARLATTILTSDALRDGRRALHRARRRLRRAPRTATFFCQIDDPYAPLAIGCLKRLADRFELQIDWQIVPAPAAGAAPEPLLLTAYARRDAARLAAALDGRPRRPALVPDALLVRRAERIAAAAIASPRPAPKLIAIAQALAEPDAPAAIAALADSIGEAPAEAALAEGAARRERMGHYLGSVTAFEGECYWGIDRLHYLEARLASEDGVLPVIAPLLDAAPQARPIAAPATPPRLDFYLSFRSPYTLIAAERIGALAAAYGADLRLRFVLPMVMRGLPVPPAKRLYITLDTRREAARHGIAFGTIHDPVGLGVERGLAVLHHAIAAGRGLDFAIQFLRGAFAQGIDMTRDQGLIGAAARAGISADAVHAALADESWRAVAEANRAALFALGMWGVPSFQVDDRPGWWGQDRLWAVEDDLRAALALDPIDRRAR